MKRLRVARKAKARAKTKPVGAIHRLLGERIRSVRKDRGWSQERLAEECDLHRTYIGGIERGERNVSLVNIARIADSLQLAVVQLFSEA